MPIQLSKYRAVPSGMSFDLDTGPAPRMAYMLMTPGNAVVVSLAGLGDWTVEVLATYDGRDYELVATHSLPGEWRYVTKVAATVATAVALRVQAYTSGVPVGMLAHGGLVPVTNVSPLFGSFLGFSFRTGATEPPGKSELKFNSTLIGTVTKLWIDNTAEDGTDQFQALRRIPPGGVLLLQERGNHLVAVLFGVVGPIVDKLTYVEIPVALQEHTGAFSPQGKTPMLVAAFNPGAAISLHPGTRLDTVRDRVSDQVTSDG